MVGSIEDRVLDFGLNVLDTETNFISINSAEPTTIAIASGIGLLGYKTGPVGSLFGPPSPGSPNGRQVTSITISDGTITTSGTAYWWACYAAGTLHAHGTLSGLQVVTAGNTFTLAPITIKIPAF